MHADECDRTCLVQERALKGCGTMKAKAKSLFLAFAKALSDSVVAYCYAARRIQSLNVYWYNNGMLMRICRVSMRCSHCSSLISEQDALVR